MTKRFRFQLNRSGVRELMKSEKMKSGLMEIATSVKHRAGEGYETDAYTGPNRANVSVYADTYEARKDNADNNTLLKALR